MKIITGIIFVTILLLALWWAIKSGNGKAKKG